MLRGNSGQFLLHSFESGEVEFESIKKCGAVGINSHRQGFRR